MDLDYKERKLLIIAVLIIVLGLGINYIYRNRQVKNMDIIEEKLDANEDVEDSKYIEEIDMNNDIMIHISGAVKKPGIIEIELGKRLIDVVELAGGLEEEADLDKINLARKVSDEEKIYIPTIGEEVELGILDETLRSEDVVGNNKKIDINNCDKNDLMKLPGIGDKTSDKIMEYRITRKFEAIDDIMGVPGIGEKKFEAIKNLIEIE